MKLTFDTDKFVAFNRKGKQLDAEEFARSGRVEFKHDILRAHGETVRLLVNKEPVCTPFLGVGVNDVLATSWQWSSQLYLNLFVANTAANDTAARNITMREEGHALHATLPVWFGRPEDGSSWFDPKPYSKAELVLTQGVASAVCQVALEQVRTY